MKVERSIEKRNRLVREIVETLILTALMFLIINIVVQNYDVEGPSMEPSLHNQERIMVDKLSYLFHAPSRGDIVVFIAPPHPNLNYVKRIIAIPGDVVTINDTTVTVDGVDLKESYVAPDYQGNPYGHRPFPIYNRFVMPAGKYLALGDDRADSSDSRDWGLLPRNNIIGRAALVYWPFGKDNNGFLPNVSSVFEKVHQTTGQSTGLLHASPVSEQNSGTFVSNEMVVMALPGLSLLCSCFAKKRRHL